METLWTHVMDTSHSRYRMQEHDLTVGPPPASPPQNYGYEILCLECNTTVLM